MEEVPFHIQNDYGLQEGCNYLQSEEAGSETWWNKKQQDLDLALKHGSTERIKSNITA